MAIRLSEARTLCTAPERTLVLASAAATVKRLTVDQLRAKIRRARALRDKFRDLAQRQQRETRGKQPARGSKAAAGNARTVRKHQLFAETLERFEARLKALTAAEAKPAPAETAPAQAPPRRKAPAPVPTTTGRRTGIAGTTTGRSSTLKAQSDATRGVRARTQQQRSNLKKIQGHVSSRGRRSQAKRDAR